MPWGAAIAAVAAIGGSMISSNAAGDAADAQQDAADRATAEQRRQFDMLQANQQPYMQYGQAQLGLLGQMMAGDYSGFEDSPDYKFALEQGEESLNRMLASRGSYHASGVDEDRLKLAQGLATQNLGNYRGALQWGANLGQNAAAGVGQAGMQSANSIGGYLMNAGDARAQSLLAQGNQQAGALGAMGSAFGDYWGQRQANTGGGGSSWADGSSSGGSWGGMSWDDVNYTGGG